MKSNFSLYEQKLTNKSINILYKPTKTVSSYTYKLYKDGKLFDERKQTKPVKSQITLGESGVYRIEVVIKHTDGTTSKEESGLYQLDLDAPKILLKEDYIEMHPLKSNDEFNLEAFQDQIRVYDEQGGNLYSALTCEVKDNDFTQLGIQKVNCVVSDEANNRTEKELIFHLTKDYSKELNVLISLLILGLMIFIIYLIRFYRSVHLEKKIIPYSIEPIQDKRKSIFDYATRLFSKCLKKINSVISKSTMIQNYAKKYEKYVPLYEHVDQTGMDFVSMKIWIAFVFILISILSNIIRYQWMNVYELFLPFIFGFFLPDILYMVQYRLYKNRLENDLLQAIIIMNNAFKSGRSITQAIELVTKELSGPIGLEFKKMHVEISFGLSIEEVFRRLADRIQMEEVTYLTASLSILNKTGGNIIKVFSSIEKTLFNKKKLKLELASLTGSSKIIVYVLFAVPFFFILFISLISPTYFAPFYQTTPGLILMGIMIVLYLIYIWFIQKIMRVRM